MSRILEVRADRTLHEFESGLAYYNYEGVHFRVFKNFEDGKLWLENGDNSLVIAEFDNERDLDKFLYKVSFLCFDCTQNPIDCEHKSIRNKGFYSSPWCNGFSLAVKFQG